MKGISSGGIFYSICDLTSNPLLFGISVGNHSRDHSFYFPCGLKQPFFILWNARPRKEPRIIEPPLLIDSHFWDTYWKTSHFYDYRRPRPKLWPNKVILGTFVTITKIGVLYEHYDKVTLFWAQKLFNKSLASYHLHLNLLSKKIENFGTVFLENSAVLLPKKSLMPVFDVLPL